MLPISPQWLLVPLAPWGLQDVKNWAVERATSDHSLREFCNTSRQLSLTVEHDGGVSGVDGRFRYCRAIGEQRGKLFEAMAVAVD